MPRATTNCIALLAPLLIAACASQPGPQTTVLIPAEHDSTRAPTLVVLPTNWAANAVRALRISPGCSGVELAGTQSGKQCIFALFKDRASLVTWYRSEAHQSLLGKVVSYREGRDFTPAAAMNDDGPVMVIATMTPVAQSETVPPRTVLLSVELFRPTPGGVRFGNASFIAQ